MRHITKHFSTQWSKIGVPLFALLAFVLVYQILLTIPLEKYSTFIELSWKSSPDCAQDYLPQPLSGAIRTIGTSSTSQARRFCESENFTMHSHSSGHYRLEFEFAAKLPPRTKAAKNKAAIEVRKTSGQPLARIPLENTLGSERLWENTSVQLPAEVLQEPWHVVLIQRSTQRAESQPPGALPEKLAPGDPPQHWAVLRSRVNLYYTSGLQDKLRNWSASPKIRKAALGGCAFILWLLVFWFARTNFGFAGTLAFLFLFSASFHFRFWPFFHWDEWHMLQRFREEGLKTVFQYHNEHFIPLFSLFYYLQALMFGANYQLYLLVSLILHALNSLMIVHLVERISRSQQVARFLGLLYALNSLHVETLQWAFEQSLQLCNLLVLIACSCATLYLETARARYLSLIALCSIAAPLCFGNGLVIFAQVGVISLLYLALQNEKLSLVTALSRGFFRNVAPFVISTASLGIPVFLYINFWATKEATTDYSQALGELLQLGQYVFVGSQLGGVFRGLGIFSSLEMPLAEQPATTILSWLPVILLNKNLPELPLACLGTAISLSLLLVSALTTRFKTAAIYWLFGEVLLIVPFILPAIARARLGVFQSLALRYQYSALFGLLILLIPLCHYCLACCRYHQAFGDRHVVNFVSVAFRGAVMIYLTIHLLLAFSYAHYSIAGKENLAFRAQLQEWQLLLKKNQSSNYEGEALSGARMHISGMQPLLPPNLIPSKPIRHPRDILQTLNWLSGTPN